MSLSITWFPPLITCHRCGKTWTPRPARGQQTPTDSSLDRETKTHFKECR
jgi:hypothetical protein